MGLDMYLSKKTYIGAMYKHREVTGSVQLLVQQKPLDIDLKNLEYVSERMAYWRKANQIHNWFVQNVQNGVDDCKEYEVSYEKLMELKMVCLVAYETKNPNLLPPTAGFFFGNTDIDEYYWEDIKNTIEMLKNLKSDGEYYYRSSW